MASNEITPTAGAYVGLGIDSKLGGGQSFGYSPDGKSFVSAITPFGFIFQQADVNRMMSLMTPQPQAMVKLTSPDGTIFDVTIANDGTLSATKEDDASGS